MNRFFIATYILFIVSCDTINPAEEIPSFIEINEITLETREPSDPDYTVNEGTSSSNIKDAWVFVDEQLDGIYEIPAIIPVPSGQHSIRVSAGIFNNSVANDRTRYPFFESYLGEYNLLPEEQIEIQPTVKYVPNGINFWHEDFEEAFIKLENRPLSEVSITGIQDPSIAFEGQGCGSIILTEDNDFYQAQTLADLDILFNRNFYLELNYKNNNRFVVGMRNDNIAVNEIAYVGFNSSFNDENELVWKKAYVFFTPILNQLGEQGDFEVFIEATKETEDPIILLDNLKLIYTD